MRCQNTSPLASLFASLAPHRVQASLPSLESLGFGLENLGFGLESLENGLESLEIGLESLISTRLPSVDFFS